MQQDIVSSQSLTVVTFLQVTVFRLVLAVLNVNDNAPEFPFTIKEFNVSEVSPVEPEMMLFEYGEGMGTEGCLGTPSGSSTYRSHSMTRPTAFPFSGHQSEFNRSP